MSHLAECLQRPRPTEILPFLCGGLLTCAFWPGLLGSSVSPRWALAALLPPLLVQKINLKVLLLLALLLCWPAATLFWTPDPLGGLNDLIRLEILCGAILLGTSRDPQELLYGMVCGVALVSSPIALGQLLGSSPVQQLVAPAGLFSNRDILGELAAPLLVWTLAAKVRGWKVLSALLAFTLLASQSRVGLLAAGVGAILLWPRRGIAGAFTCLGLIGLIGLLDPSKISTFGERLQIWRDSIPSGTSWLWGNGLESFGATFPHWSTAHSDLLQAFYELGLPATTVGVAGLGMVAWRRNISNSPYFTAFAALSCEAAVSFPLHMPTTLFLWGLLVGHLASRSTLVRRMPLGGRVSFRDSDGWATSAGAGSD